MEVEEWIQKSVRRPGPGARTGTLTLPALFQGWPHIAHGGGVLACLYALARPALPDGPHLVSPHVVSVKLHRSVDLDAPLTWQLTSLDGGVGLTLHQEERCLVEGSVRIAPAGEPVPAGLPPEAGEGEAPTVPGNANCLACGSENPIGLQIRFHYGEGAVWKTYRPRPPYRASDGSLVPAFHFIALDEIGWWLGVLSAGECGVTNEIAVRILRPVPFDTPLVISGSRAAVTPVPPLRCVADTQGFAPFDAQIVDISRAGIGFLLYASDITLEPGTVLKACRIQRHDATPITVDLAVRYTTPVVLDDGSHAHRSGCVFLNPTREVMELIESFLGSDG